MEVHGVSIPAKPGLIAFVVLAVAGLAGGYGVAVRDRPQPDRIELASPSPQAGTVKLFVHVAGAVAHPGLYQLPEGARVEQAIRAAGGPSDDADLDSLNLAAELRDGDKVLVSRHQSGDDGSPPGGGGSGAPGLVNVNTADAAELQTLPGIGPAMADRIIAYRDKHGPFRTVQELQNVSGIGPRRLEELAELVTV